ELLATIALNALAAARVPVRAVGDEPSDDDRTVLYIGLLLLYLALIAFGNVVAYSVTEEKSSRMAEVLLTTIAPRRLLAGKVLGIGLLGLGELVAVAAAGLLAGELAGGSGLPSATLGTAAIVVLWFVLGYVFYSAAFGAIGAMVSRREDLESASAPVSVVLVAAFLLAMVALEHPDGTLARVIAFVPALAPMVVPTRVILGDMGALELLATIALNALATAGLVAVAGHVYARAFARVGAPVRLRQLLAGDAARGR
ncbi:MAG TPA: ABC transporter permease, partial [Solirubrobacteraceae bacterium]|nr:ABC transporter permease [Solirubrobacteraceae bacterium]